MYFELNSCELTWSCVKSFSDLYKQTPALLLSPVFFVSVWFPMSLHKTINVYGWHCNPFSGHFHCVLVCFCNPVLFLWIYSSVFYH